MGGDCRHHQVNRPGDAQHCPGTSGAFRVPPDVPVYTEHLHVFPRRQSGNNVHLSSGVLLVGNLPINFGVALQSHTQPSTAPEGAVPPVSIELVG